MSRPAPAAALEAAMRLVCVELPHLSGLARVADLVPDDRIETAGVFASGRVVVNPTWLETLTLAEATFVLAHELMHLALGTHDRAVGSDATLFNVAHDYVINGMLSLRLGRDPPAGGLYRWGAHEQSAEALVMELRREEKRLPSHSWRGPGRGGAGHTRPRERGHNPAARAGHSTMQDAFARAGLVRGMPDGAETEAGGESSTEGRWDRLDVLPDKLERLWFPSDGEAARVARRERVARAAAASAAQEAIKAGFLAQTSWGAAPRDDESLFRAVNTLYRAPWESVLQEWVEGVAPGARSYARPSRRGDGGDAIRAGRRREGWVLHLVLDVSGSMWGVLPTVLGVLREFCLSSGVDTVFVVQCDADTQRVDVVEPADLDRFPIRGGGGSDMGPALDLLARDPDVRGVAVLTDGYVTVSGALPPFLTLWAVFDNPAFEAPFGRVIALDSDVIARASRREAVPAPDDDLPPEE